MVAQLGKCFCRSNTRTCRNTYPFEHSASNVLSKSGELCRVFVFHAREISKHFVDRVRLQPRHHVGNGALHPVRDGLVQLVVRRKNGNFVFFNDIFDLEKRHAALESRSLSFLCERHDTPVIVGENNNGFAS